MKVLQINSVCGIRSTGRICTDIADVLQKNGDECKIAYGRENVPARYQDVAVRIGNDVDVRCHALMTRIFDNTGYGSKRATKKFLKWVEEYNPDVIHLHNLHGYYINLDLLFKYLKKSRKPVIWTLHDCWAFTGHCSYFDLVGCCKWENVGCYACPQKTNYPKSVLIDRSKKNFFEKQKFFMGLDNMILVTPSQWLADLGKRSFLKDYPIKVIHNGIDLSFFKPTDGNFRDRYGLQDKTILLGVAASWGNSKGLFDFYKVNEIKAENEVLVLVGLTAKQIAELPKGIIGIERTNSVSELAEIYTAADVFINPTYQDNYPTVNLEAQACGTPAVTYHSGGSPEGVPGENVVERGNVDDLLQIARERAVMPKLLDVSGFSKEDAFSKYINLYCQLLDF